MTRTGSGHDQKRFYMVHCFIQHHPTQPINAPRPLLVTLRTGSGHDQNRLCPASYWADMVGTGRRTPGASLASQNIKKNSAEPARPINSPMCLGYFGLGAHSTGCCGDISPAGYDVCASVRVGGGLACLVGDTHLPLARYKRTKKAVRAGGPCLCVV